MRERRQRTLRVDEERKVGGPEGRPECGGCDDQGSVARTPDEGELRRGASRGRAFGIEEQERAQGDADAHEGQDKDGEASRLDEHKDAGERCEHEPVERPLACFAVKIGAGIAQHDPADERDEQGHRPAHRIQPQCQESRALPDRDSGRTFNDELEQAYGRERESAEGRTLRPEWQLPWPPAGPRQRKKRGAKKQDRGEKGQRQHGGTPVGQRLPEDIDARAAKKNYIVYSEPFDIIEAWCRSISITSASSAPWRAMER